MEHWSSSIPSKIYHTPPLNKKLLSSIKRDYALYVHTGGEDSPSLSSAGGFIAQHAGCPFGFSPGLIDQVIQVMAFFLR